MGLFDFFKKKKEELPAKQKEKTDASEREATSDAVEQDAWDRMWELWGEGNADSPYAEVLTYQSEINNGGHDQYFFNVENTGNLQREMAILETALPAKLRENLQNAYNAYRKLTNEESGEQTETMLSQYDDEFYKGEEEINCILRAYASKIGS